MTPECEAMWRTLSDLSLAGGRFQIAERCAAALGNVSRAKYLHDVNNLVREYGSDCGEVKCRIAVLEKHFKLAETLYLEQVPRRFI